MKCSVDKEAACEQREKVLIWGAGEWTKWFLSFHEFYDDMIEIIAIVDSDQKKWGGNLDGYTIVSPEEAYRMPYDRFVVPSKEYYEEIADKIVSDTKTDRSRIENIYYITKCKLNARYRLDPDKADILTYLHDHLLDIFNDPFVEKYENIHPEIGYDEEAGLFYVIHKGYRMYMSRYFHTKEMVLNYYRNLCIEQDEASPHLYLYGDFDVNAGDVVVDVGAAEGIFALGVIEKAKKIYLIETNEEWIEALGYTFRNFQDKIVIINKFIADYTGYNTTTLDDLLQENVDFIKMDVEGCEYAAMAGADRLIRNASHIKCVLCTYHNDNDALTLKILAENLGLKVSFSDGYMLFPTSNQQIYVMPTLRKGVIRCEK